LRETAAAFCREGHAVWVISPVVEMMAGEKKGDGREEETARSNEEISASPAPRRPGAAAAGDLADVMFVPVLPHKHHVQIFKELETLDQLWGMKARHTQELRRLLFNLTLYEKALNYLRSCRVDCIYERYSLFSHAGIRLARALGVPHLLEVNAPLAYAQEVYGVEMKTLARETERRIFLETDQVIVVSRQLQEMAITCGVPMGHIAVLPNAVDTLRFDPRHEDNGQAVREHFQFKSKCVIGFVGGLHSWQGVETLIAAFSRLQTVAPNTHLLIVGDGPEREKLERQAEATGLRNDMTFTGKISYDEVPHYIAAMNITVAPYKDENFYQSPMPIFEYMAMGKPIVASSIGQVNEVIAHGETGVLYTPGNFAQLTAALAKLAGNVLLCRRLGENARAWIQKERRWENNAQQIVKIAGVLIKKRNNAGNEIGLHFVANERQ
jgi:glycosyltransferase involved in cell wall biosynthesis